MINVISKKNKEFLLKIKEMIDDYLKEEEKPHIKKKRNYEPVKVIFGDGELQEKDFE